MYGILWEDESDTNTLREIVRKWVHDDSLPVHCSKYSGSGELLKNGRRDLCQMSAEGYKKFIVCHDADGPDPSTNREKVWRRIVEPSGLAEACCVVVPVQELEAWLLADIKAVTKMFSSWKPKAVKNPESIVSPKEFIEKLSEDSKGKKRYRHAIHNEKLAKHIDLAKVARLCPSFRSLVAFIDLAV